MPHTNRFQAFGAFLSFASLASVSLLVAACGSNPEVSNGQGTFVPDGGGQTMMNGPDSGGPNLNLDGGNNSDSGTMTDAGSTPDAGPVCGDGVIDAPETCDDGNSIPGDGCDGNCQIEGTAWSCPTPGQPCVPVTTPAVWATASSRAVRPAISAQRRMTAPKAAPPRVTP
jgi:cysteine-rich repeat protein